MNDPCIVWQCLWCRGMVSEASPQIATRCEEQGRSDGKGRGAEGGQRGRRGGGEERGSPCITTPIPSHPHHIHWGEREGGWLCRFLSTTCPVSPSLSSHRHQGFYLPYTFLTVCLQYLALAAEAHLVQLIQGMARAATQRPDPAR